MDRIKMLLTNVDASWLVGLRNCVNDRLTTGMSWPIDTHMYIREQVTPDQIEQMELNPELFTYEHLGVDYRLFYNFIMSTYTPKEMETLNISSIGLHLIMRETMFH